MVILNDFEFGYANAITELRRAPKIFDTAFYDRWDYINEILYGFKFLVHGRKGTGKSALGAKINRIAEKTPNLIVSSVSLEDFEYRTFSKISSATQSGGFRYSASWKLMLLLQVYSCITQIDNLSDFPQIDKLSKKLEKFGLLPTEGISRVVRQVSKRSFKITLPFNFGGLEIGGHDKELELSSPEEISEVLLRNLQDLYLQPFSIRIVIDGLDDALRGKTRQLEIVTGLIRAADSLNNTFVDFKLPIKFIVLVRTDIINECNDMDLNKIKRDSEIPLNWREETDLFEMVKLRFSTALPLEQCDQLWYNLFPRVLKDKDSFHYILEHTLYRPRDVLQFLIECKKLYPNSSQLSYSEVNRALESYSENYFVDEMKNELAGFVPDDVVKAIPSVLSRILRPNTNTFTATQWGQGIAETLELAEVDAKKLLEKLFDGGFVGQLRDRGFRGNYVVFSHRDSQERVNFDDKFIIHKGFWKALNIS